MQKSVMTEFQCMIYKMWDRMYTYLCELMDGIMQRKVGKL